MSQGDRGWRPLRSSFPGTSCSHSLARDVRWAITSPPPPDQLGALHAEHTRLPPGTGERLRPASGKAVTVKGPRRRRGGGAAGGGRRSGGRAEEPPRSRLLGHAEALGPRRRREHMYGGNTHIESPQNRRVIEENSRLLAPGRSPRRWLRTFPCDHLLQQQKEHVTCWRDVAGLGKGPGPRFSRGRQGKGFPPSGLLTFAATGGSRRRHDSDVTDGEIEPQKHQRLARGPSDRDGRSLLCCAPAFSLPYVPLPRTAARHPRGQDAPPDAPQGPCARGGLTRHVPEGQSLARQDGVPAANAATVGGLAAQRRPGPGPDAPRAGPVGRGARRAGPGRRPARPLCSSGPGLRA